MFQLKILKKKQKKTNKQTRKLSKNDKFITKPRLVYFVTASYF